MTHKTCDHVSRREMIYSILYGFRSRIPPTAVRLGMYVMGGRHRLAALQLPRSMKDLLTGASCLGVKT